MVLIFCTRPFSSSPAPRPVTAATGWAHSTAVSAAQGVVLPMPMSPGMSRSIPSPMSWAAVSAPTAMARRAWSKLMAGSWARFLVPLATLAWISPGVSSKS